MKYYVYSPLGRTGSIRLLYYINSSLNGVLALDRALAISKSFQSHHDDKYGAHVFRIKDSHSEIVEKEEKLDYTVVDNVKHWIFPKELSDLVPDSLAMHSHTCMWVKDNDWTHILTTRRDKTELPMSLVIAVSSGDWKADPDDKKSDIKPFELHATGYLDMLKQCEARERAFLKGVKKDTGKDAIIIYLEDTRKEIEEKLGMKISEKSFMEREKHISSRRPKDYILNYDELKEVYDDFIENKEYYMSIPFEDVF